jgi:hypothetical protein
VEHDLDARYGWDAGVAIGRFLDGLEEGLILGRECRSCRRILVPPRMFCERCFRGTDAWVEVQQTGIVQTFSICHVRWDMQPLDEPTSALDIGHQQQALELVSRLQNDHGLTVISAMHDLTLAGMYSNRLALLHEGTVVARGPAADVLRAETLAEFYGVRVSVHHESDGTVIVVPRREGAIT